MLRVVGGVSVFFVSLLFSVSATSSEMCPELSRNASKLAQDYRNAVGKVRIACDSSFEECNQSRVIADQALDSLIAANQAMLQACEFVNPTTDDALPVTIATVVAAIDTFPVSALVPCSSVATTLGPVEIGCPNGWVLNIPRAIVDVSPITATSFSYQLNVNASASIPIDPPLLGTCTLNVTTSTGIPVLGTATFSSSVAGGTINRLQLAVNSLSVASLQFTGCGVLSDVLQVIATDIVSLASTFITTAVAGNFCGADGPELFGTCP